MGRLWSLLSVSQSAAACRSSYRRRSRHTQAKEAGADDGEEEEGEAQVEVLVLGDGGLEGLAGGRLPDVVQWGRHQMGRSVKFWWFMAYGIAWEYRA